MMHENSLSAHNENLSSGKYPKMKERIIETVQYLGSASMPEIAQNLGVPINKISGRFSELVKAEKLEIVSSIKVGSYNYSIYKIKDKE